MPGATNLYLFPSSLCHQLKDERQYHNFLTLFPHKLIFCCRPHNSISLVFFADMSILVPFFVNDILHIIFERYNVTCTCFFCKKLYFLQSVQLIFVLTFFQNKCTSQYFHMLQTLQDSSFSNALRVKRREAGCSSNQSHSVIKCCSLILSTDNLCLPFFISLCNCFSTINFT